MPFFPHQKNTSAGSRKAGLFVHFLLGKQKKMDGGSCGKLMLCAFKMQLELRRTSMRSPGKVRRSYLGIRPYLFLLCFTGLPALVRRRPKSLATCGGFGRTKSPLKAFILSSDRASSKNLKQQCGVAISAGFLFCRFSFPKEKRRLCASQ